MRLQISFLFSRGEHTVWTESGKMGSAKTSFQCKESRVGSSRHGQTRGQRNMKLGCEGKGEKCTQVAPRFVRDERETTCTIYGHGRKERWRGKRGSQNKEKDPSLSHVTQGVASHSKHAAFSLSFPCSSLTISASTPISVLILLLLPACLLK